MNREVGRATFWMKTNKLTINASISCTLVITPGAKTATKKKKIM